MLVPIALCAQTADDHFHRGAQYYVFGRKTNAIVEVVTGLKKFPEDEKLKALAEVLAKEEEKQQPQQQQQQQNQDQKKEEEQKQQEQQQSNRDQQQQQENKDQQQNQQQSASGEQKDDKQQDAESAATQTARRMTPQEAQQLLDAQKGEEKLLQFKPAEPLERRQRVLKDW